MFSTLAFAIFPVLAQQRGVTDRNALNRIALIGGVVGLSPVGFIVGDNLIRREVEATTVQPPAKVFVPNVFGRDFTAASNEIGQRGLQAVEGPRTEVTSDARLEGKVTATAPPAGAEVDPNSVVTVFIAQPAKVAVPYVFGLDFAIAKKEFDKRNLLVSEPADEEDPKENLGGRVLRTDPPAGIEVDDRTKPVKVTVGKRSR